jgi:predicted alpha/beta-fold hydrolase
MHKYANVDEYYAAASSGGWVGLFRAQMPLRAKNTSDTDPHLCCHHSSACHEIAGASAAPPSPPNGATAAGRLLQHVGIPFLLLNAIDDPVCATAGLPLDKVAANDNVSGLPGCTVRPPCCT